MSTRRAFLTGACLLAIVIAGALGGRACRETPAPPVSAAPAPRPEPVVLPPAAPPPVPPERIPPPPPKPSPPPPRPRPAPVAALDGPIFKPGAILGSVAFSGRPPFRRRLHVAADPACAAQYPDGMPDDSLVIDRDLKVRWAFVYVAVGVRGIHAPPKTPVVLEQKACRYTPHVVGVQVDQALVVRNSDPVLHNVHFLSFANREFCIGRAPNSEETFRFAQREIMIKAKCDIHPWESAWVGVLDHPFFGVSDALGRYAITGLPPGRYTVKAWHERLEAGPQEVDVVEDGTESVDFSMRLR